MHPNFALKLALALTLPLIAAASTPVPPQVTPVEGALARAIAEQRQASRAAEDLRRAADQARGTAERLAAEQAAAGEALVAAEAGITAAEARLKIAAALVASHRAQLAREQRPAANLLAGLALMARQPPLLALADHGSAAELVKVRVLIGSTVPAIRARTASLAAALAEGRNLERSAARARAALAQSRRDLLSRRAEFARLEQRALEQAATAGSRSLSAGDTVLAAGEDIARLRSEQAGSAEARALAALLAMESPPPARPAAGEGAAALAPFAYSLPAQAPVTTGMGAISPSGVRSRGVTLATPRGVALVAPAAGVVRFAGPFREYDGVLIIDHGGGWLTLIVNAASTVARGSKVAVRSAAWPRARPDSGRTVPFRAASLAGSHRRFICKGCQRERKGG